MRWSSPPWAPCAWSAPKQLDILDPKEFRFLWVTEFPMFEWSEEEGRYQAMHHPFTAPMLEDEDKMLTDKANCRARAYDIVLNGTELGGGSIRINTPEMQTKAFEALGISDEDIQERFGHLVNAFQYGAPPHGRPGLRPGPAGDAHDRGLLDPGCHRLPQGPECFRPHDELPGRGGREAAGRLVHCGDESGGGA